MLLPITTGVFLLALLDAVTADNCCSRLANAYPSKLYYPYQQGYKTANGNGIIPNLGFLLQSNYPYWSTQGIADPACVFTAKTVSDVSNAVKILHDNRCQYAIRSGGHNPIPEWSNTNGGVLLSTSDIKDVTYDLGASTVKFGAGCKWGDIYDVLDPIDMGTMGGRDNTVGTGGFLLGGGISYYSNSRGWSADHITAFDVVYANGTTGTITAQSYPDLFTAMKGAGSSFAIVTHFTQEMLPQATYNAGFVFYPGSSIPRVISTVYNYSTVEVFTDLKSHVIPAFTSIGPDVDLNALGLLGLGINADVTDLGAFCFFYPTALGLGEADVFKPFTKQIPFLATTKRDRNGINSISAEIAGYSGPGKRQSFTDMVVVLDDPTILQALFDKYQTVTQPYRLLIAGYISSFIFYPLHSNFVAQGMANGKKNSMGLEDSPAGQAGKTIMIVSINLSWQLKAHDALAAECVGKAFAALQSLAESRGLYHPFKYMNYANGTQDVLAGYGTASVARLQQVKAAVDPMNDFGTLVKGRYKIPGI
ncbi:hypothetical protein H072_4616 [Dactylellina haptotyla CBS 200.50]|uniref:FAD-binding PCMH-type domain-containing protein n=1 Tax=Dactylellina haptotyla (strain CBS 200.50) TaxID=1284197 RepID=S8AK31_DACHA|nr:hypothetical protein H072_4616 [Dactylellina haptotyla CBS 200.50]